jgi:hypothetical protein
MSEPTPAQFAESAEDADALARTLRALASLKSRGTDADYDRLADALLEVSTAVDRLRFKLVTGQLGEGRPGAASLADTCAMLLIEMYNHGRAGLDRWVDEIADQERSLE